MSRQGEGKRRRRGISRARACVCLAVFASVVIGLMLHAGWGTLSSMGVEALSYICPLGAIQTLIAAHVPVPRLVVSLVVIVVAVALLGRTFCAWVCPVPPIERFFRPNGKSGGRPRRKGLAREPQEGQEGASCQRCEQSCSSAGCVSGCAGAQRNGLQIDSRHGVLLGAVAGSAVLGFPVFCLICPIGLSLATVIAVWRMLFVHEVTWSVVVFSLVVVAEVVLFKKWCHKICPLGALLSLVGQKGTLFRPRVKAAECMREAGHDCHACVEACPEQLDPHEGHIPECTRCGKCVEACPAQALSMRPVLLSTRSRRLVANDRACR